MDKQAPQWFCGTAQEWAREDLDQKLRNEGRAVWRWVAGMIVGGALTIAATDPKLPGVRESVNAAQMLFGAMMIACAGMAIRKTTKEENGESPLTHALLRISAEGGTSDPLKRLSAMRQMVEAAQAAMPSAQRDKKERQERKRMIKFDAAVGAAIRIAKERGKRADWEKAILAGAPEASAIKENLTLAGESPAGAAKAPKRRPGL